MRHRALSILVCLLAATALLTAAGCGQAKRWNLLLVTFDTTRTDHIGCYGHARAHTPTVDRLAAEGIRFTQARAALPITLPEHTTILTGKYPTGHGVRDNGLFVLAPEQETLAELLKRHGYATAAAVAGFPLLAKYGLDQGFDLYDDKLEQPEDNLFGQRLLARPRLFGSQRKAARVNEAVFGWLEQQRSGPFFLWVHYYDPHQPLEPPPPYDQTYADDLYDGEIAYADECLGVLLARLERLGLDHRTLVVFTADHGEGLGEHNESTHSLLAYDSTLHVPLVIRPPGGPAGQVVEERVNHVDIVPTVLELLRLPAAPASDGVSLVPLLRGGGTVGPRPLYAETLSPRLSNGWGELRALFDGRFKYIHGSRPELFDLEADPREVHDLAGERPELAVKLRDKLAGFIRAHASATPSTAVPVDEQTRQELLALGYLQPGHDAATVIVEELRGDGLPPQDRIADVSGLSTVRDLLQRGQPLAAKPLVEGLLAGDPDNALYLEMLATAQLELGELDAAVRTLDRSLAGGGHRYSSPSLLLEAGYQLYLRGDRAEGTQLVRQSLDLSPTAPASHLLTVMLAEQGSGEDRLAGLERTLKIDPDYAPARVGLANLLAERGDRQRAEAEYLRVIAARPYNPRAQYNFGTFLVQTGRPDEALGHFERAVELDPGYLKAYRAVVLVHLGRGEAEEARRALARLEAAAPGSPEATDARKLVEEHG